MWNSPNDSTPLSCGLVGCRTPSAISSCQSCGARSLETPSAALDNLNRMEKLGLLSSVLDWVEARNLRNRLVHEYLRDADDFAGALDAAHQLVPLLIETYNRLNTYSQEHFATTSTPWPPMLPENQPGGRAG